VSRVGELILSCKMEFSIVFCLLIAVYTFDPVLAMYRAAKGW